MSFALQAWSAYVCVFHIYVGTGRYPTACLSSLLCIPGMCPTPASSSSVVSLLQGERAVMSLLNIELTKWNMITCVSLYTAFSCAMYIHVPHFYHQRSLGQNKHESSTAYMMQFVIISYIHRWAGWPSHLRQGAVHMCRVASLLCTRILWVGVPLSSPWKW